MDIQYIYSSGKKNLTENEPLVCSQEDEFLPPVFGWFNIIFDKVLNPVGLVGPDRSGHCAPAQRPKNGYFQKLLTLYTLMLV